MIAIRRLWLALLFMAGIADNIVVAKKDEEQGTAFPSESPSEFPSDYPSVAPSNVPTPAPTGSPTISSAPSSSPTEFPTARPSPSPTDEPTGTPSAHPTGAPSQKIISTVRFPPLGLDLILSDSDATSPKLNELDMKLTSFLLEVLAENSGVGTFDYAEFQFDVILSVFGRRRLDTGLSIQIGGTTYFGGGEAPSEDDLTQNLLTYFSFWGVQDLEAYLKVTVGLQSSRIAGISVDGNPVKYVKQDGHQGGAQVEQKKTIGENSVFTPAVIAGIAAGFVLLVLTTMFCVSKSRKSHGPAATLRRERKKKRASAPSEDARTGRIGATAVQDDAILNHLTSDDDSDSIAISVDTSLYTTGSVPVPRTRSYDAKRLDRVIAAAKQHTEA